MPPPAKKPRKNSAEKAKIREVIDEGTRGKRTNAVFAFSEFSYRETNTLHIFILEGLICFRETHL